jgi:hypothetical protein
MAIMAILAFMAISSAGPLRDSLSLGITVIEVIDVP